MPERIKPRRPIAWNQLLTKGHAHTKVRSAQRRQQRQQLDAEIEEYFISENPASTSRNNTKDRDAAEQFRA